MASGLSAVVVLALCVFLSPFVSAGYRDCESYKDSSNMYQPSQKCQVFCCGTCFNRYCCDDTFSALTEEDQDNCDTDISPTYYTIVGIIGSVISLLIAICCCVCPCCCLYKMCRKPQPVIATTTHTTVVTTTPQSYPQQPMASGTPRQVGVQYPSYQPVPVQSGYGSQPVPQGYGPQPMHLTPYPGQPFTPGPPPTYQEASESCPAYPPTPMPYSQAAFNPGQPSYPLQPPAQPPQPNAPPAQPDFLAQPAYNPDFVAPPPKTGY